MKKSTTLLSVTNRELWGDESDRSREFHGTRVLCWEHELHHGGQTLEPGTFGDASCTLADELPRDVEVDAGQVGRRHSGEDCSDGSLQDEFRQDSVGWALGVG